MKNQFNNYIFRSQLKLNLCTYFSYLFSITRRIKLSFLSTNGINAFLCKNNQFSSNKDKQTHTIIKRFNVITIGGNETYVPTHRTEGCESGTYKL